MAGLVALAAGACGAEQGPRVDGPSDEGPSPIERDPEAMYSVAAEPHATLGEIVETGIPVSVAVSGSGGRLIVYLAGAVDDEGTEHSAWRFYDADGEVLSEGRGEQVGAAAYVRPRPWGCPGGVLLWSPSVGESAFELVDDEGVVNPVETVFENVPTEPGDLVIHAGYGLYVIYRPSERTAYRLSQSSLLDYLPTAAIDSEGGVWALGDRNQHTARVLYSADGGDPWQESQIALRQGSYPAHIVATEDKVAIPVVGDGADLYELTALYVRDAVQPAEEPWRSIDVGPIEEGIWMLPPITAVDEERLLIGDDADWYLGSEDGDWVAVPLPSSGRHDRWHLTYANERLYAYGGALGSAYVSDDLGESWDELPR